MKIKKFTAPTIKHALAEIKHELGENAVILHSKKVNGGLLDFGTKEVYEVTAAIDENDVPRMTKTRTAPASESYILRPSEKKTEPVEEKTEWRSVEKLEEITSEVQEIKTVIHRLADNLKYQNVPTYPPLLTKLYVTLLDAGVGISLAQELIQQVFQETTEDELNELTHLRALLKTKMGHRLYTKSVSRPRDGYPHVIALIGPTGVGKTTTLAKMATNPEIYGRERAAFITIDTYRIAAIEQLKTFARIAQIPMEVAYTMDEIHRAIKKFRDRDVILIDTPGRSPNNRHHLIEMKEFIERAQPDEIHLVLNITTRHEDVEDIIKKYEMFKAHRLVFTKLDETTAPGEIINVTEQFRKPVSFITNGQEVPEDIQVGESGKIINTILKDKI